MRNIKSLCRCKNCERCFSTDSKNLGTIVVCDHCSKETIAVEGRPYKDADNLGVIVFLGVIFSVLSFIGYLMKVIVRNGNIPIGAFLFTIIAYGFSCVVNNQR